MKAMGTGSIASFVKILLDLAWGAMAFGLMLMMLLLMYAAFFDLPGDRSAELDPFGPGADIQREADPGLAGGWHLVIPVVFELDADTYNITSTAPGINNMDIRDASAYLRFPVQRGGFFYANFAMIVILVSVALWVVTQLRHVFRTLRDGRPFVSANARRIHWIGLAVILGELIRAGVLYAESYYAAAHFAANGIRFVTALDINGIAIVHGLVILVIAAVFREGTRLEEEQSLTV